MLARLIRIRYFRLDTAVILQVGQSLLSTPSALRFASLSLPFTNSHCRCWFMSHASHTFTARSPCEGSSATPLLISVFVALVVVVVTHTHTGTHTQVRCPVPAVPGKLSGCWKKETVRIFGASSATFFVVVAGAAHVRLQIETSAIHILIDLSVAFPPSLSSSPPSCRVATCRLVSSHQTPKHLTDFSEATLIFFFGCLLLSLTLFVVFWDLFSFFFLAANGI